MSRSVALLCILPFVASAAGHPYTGRDSDYAHIARRALPGPWHQENEHSVHELFNKRQNFPAVGTSEWAAGYPENGNDIGSSVPQEWKDALAAAVNAGKIPNIPQSVSINDGSPIYPDGLDPNSPEICSSTYKECRNPNDIWDAPDGFNGISFDDGPDEVSNRLYDFLGQNKQKATHFMIGEKVLRNPKEFLRAYEELGNPIAGHSWSHRYMTTLSNEELLGELGFMLKVVHASTGGRLFKYWRPPYGNSDNRVSAIALHVFGMTTVIWNQDTADWSLLGGGTTLQVIDGQMRQWLNGPKSPGLVILEHEHSPLAVDAFIAAYPLMMSTGWKTVALTEIEGSSWQNAQGNTGPVSPKEVGSGASEDEADVENVSKAGSSAKTVLPTASVPTTSNASSASPSPTGNVLADANKKEGEGSGAISSTSISGVVAGFAAILLAL